MAAAQDARMAATHEPAKVGELLKHIGDDVKTIAVSELELGRTKLANYLERTVLKAAVMILSAIVALVGFAMLCMVAVVALEPVIPALWLRLLLMSFVFIAVGGSAAYIFAKKMLGGPNLANEVDEVGQTIDKVSDGLAH
jgi:hypothetical protein